MGIGEQEQLLFFINTVGSEKERCISPHLSWTSMKMWLGKAEPFLYNGNLHWLPSLGGQNKILVFDTLTEVFGSLCPPGKIRAVASFLEIEGMLAMSNCHVGSSKVDLWLLQDYKRVVWVHKYRIQLPVMEIRRFERDGGWCSHVLSKEGDVLVDGLDWQFHYDIKGNLLDKFQCSGRLLTVTPHILRESLVPHEVFRLQENESKHEPPFFRGL
ncbi:hypothetical protein ACP70R_017332 [Stipagrostis hirtigluma subsp. patula]